MFLYEFFKHPWCYYLSFLPFSLLPTHPHPFTDKVCSPFFSHPIHRTYLHYHPVKSLFSSRFPIPFCLLASSVTSGCIFKSNYQELEHTNKRKQVAAVFLGPGYLAQYNILRLHYLSKDFMALVFFAAE